MSSIPYVATLPQRPDLEQLKRQAKDLQRAVRGGRPVALELAAHHAPHRLADPAAFALDAAQLVIARFYGFASWQSLRRHLDEGGAGGRIREGVRTTADYYRLRPDWVSAEDMRRCAAAVRDLSDSAHWVPLLSTRYNGLSVVAFDAPEGVVVAELTPTRITWSVLDARRVPRDAVSPASVEFHTRFGTIAGLIEPGIARLGVERPADIRTRQNAVIVHGVFVVPGAFLVDESGVVLRADDRPRGEIVPRPALPPQAKSTLDRPGGGAASTPAAAGDRAELAAVLEAADAPPIVDPELWRVGVRAQVAIGESVQLGRYGNLLVWHHGGDRASIEDPFVFDFTAQRGPIRDFAVVGRSISVTRLYYDFRDGEGRIAVVGLIDDDRITSVMLRREGLPDLVARIAGGTFLISAPDLKDLREDGRDRAYVVALDRLGGTVEHLAYRG